MKIQSATLRAVLLCAVLLSACGGSTPSSSNAYDDQSIGTAVAETTAARPTETLIPLPPPTEAPAPAPTVDPSDGWALYENAGLGYAFRYPTDKFTVIGDNPLKLENAILPAQAPAGPGYGWLYYEVEVTPVDPNLHVLDWVRQNWPNQDNALETITQIDGLDAVRYHVPDPGTKSNIHVFVIHNGNLFQISGHYFNEPGSPYHEEIESAWLETTEAFLGSFKFAR